MSKLSLFKIEQNELGNLPIIDGQLIYTIDTKKIYIDSGKVRTVAGGDAIVDFLSNSADNKITFIKSDGSTIDLTIEDNTKLPLSGGDMVGNINFKNEENIRTSIYGKVQGATGIRTFNEEGLNLISDGGNIKLFTMTPIDQENRKFAMGITIIRNQRIIRLFEIDEFDINNAKIIGLADPIDNTDAVNKQYVDNQIGDIETILATLTNPTVYEPIIVNTIELIENSSYRIDTYSEFKALRGVPINTTVAAVKESIIGDNIEIRNASNEIVTDDDIIKTGYNINAIIDNNIIDNVKVVIRGDYNGDGAIDMVDAKRIEDISATNDSSLIDILTLDFDNDNYIGLTDLVTITNYIRGNTNYSTLNDIGVIE